METHEKRPTRETPPRDGGRPNVPEKESLLPQNPEIFCRCLPFLPLPSTIIEWKKQREKIKLIQSAEQLIDGFGAKADFHDKLWQARRMDMMELGKEISNCHRMNDYEGAKLYLSQYLMAKKDAEESSSKKIYFLSRKQKLVTFCKEKHLDDQLDKDIADFNDAFHTYNGPGSEDQMEALESFSYNMQEIEAAQAELNQSITTANNGEVESMFQQFGVEGAFPAGDETLKLIAKIAAQYSEAIRTVENENSTFAEPLASPEDFLMSIKSKKSPLSEAMAPTKRKTQPPQMQLLA
jgi:hypothetical protein